ncbi:MAG: putative ABC transporter permease [Clostridia bacterium]|nr:putative ABC transporter permease [Clostridia bacterium]
MVGFQKFAYIFFFYAIGGWFMESIRGWIITKKFVNRGFLIGPCLPVYGWGLVLLTLVLEDYTNDIVVLFFMSIVLCRNAGIFYELDYGEAI